MKILMLTFFIMSFTLLNSFSVTANEWHSTGGHLIFTAIGRPAMLKIIGEAPVPSAKITFEGGQVSLVATIVLDRLKTGIDLRDEHMKKNYLEIQKYPQAKLIIQNLNLLAKQFTGSLDLHGKIHPVQGTFEMGSDKKAKAKFELKLADFGINVPEYLGITVSEVVKVDTEIQFGDL